MLRRYISESKDLNVPVNYFFDLMRQDNILFAKNHYLLNNLNQHPMLDAVVKIVGNMICDFLNKPVSVVPEFFNVFAGEHFYHGSCKISDYPVPLLILFCADIQIGVAALTDMVGKTDIFRFSLTALDGSEKKLH